MESNHRNSFCPVLYVLHCSFNKAFLKKEEKNVCGVLTLETYKPVDARCHHPWRDWMLSVKFGLNLDRNLSATSMFLSLEEMPGTVRESVCFLAELQ